MKSLDDSNWTLLKKNQAGRPCVNKSVIFKLFNPLKDTYSRLFHICISSAVTQKVSIDKWKYVSVHVDEDKNSLMIRQEKNKKSGYAIIFNKGLSCKIQLTYNKNIMGEKVLLIIGKQLKCKIEEEALIVFFEEIDNGN